MGMILNRAKYMIRISPKQASKLEYSTNSGKSWMTLYAGSAVGNFQDLVDNGREILAYTSKGLYASSNEGKIWMKRSS